MTLKITADNIDLGTLTSVTGPKITLVDYPGDDLATTPTGGATVAITGTGFVNGCQVLVDSTYATTVTFVSSTSISFTTPAMSAGTYPIYVINPDGGTAIAIPGVSYSGVPAFSTSSGSLGTVYEGAAFGSNIAATSDSAVTYSIDSGALPAGFSLNANTGAIAGNVGTISNSTTYNFTVKATDVELQDTTRNFSITTSPDVVTFNTPAGNQTYSNAISDSFSLTLNATSVLGTAISYTANALPGGISLSSNVISGTFSSAASVASLITATAATSLKTATRLLSWTITSPTLAIDYLIVGGGGGSNTDIGAGGGGGAGGYLTTIGGSQFNASIGTAYTITIGAGGGTTSGTQYRGLSGSNSTAFGFTAYGGGYWSIYTGANGGSGGGGGSAGGEGKGVYPGSTYIDAPRQGYDGYGGGNWGAGGGAGGAGSGTTGGPGVSNNITGIAYTYSIGGSGYTGTSYSDPAPAGSGTYGKGGDGSKPGPGGSGNGVVVIRYSDTLPAAASTTGSPTITVAGGYRVYKFTGSGSITF